MSTTMRPVSPLANADATLSVESILTTALAAMRDHAESGPADDFYANHARTLLDQRPLITIGIIGKGQSFAWAFEPGDRDGAECAISAHVSHYPPDVEQRGVTSHADVMLKNYVLSEIERLVAWLWKGETGMTFAAQAERAIR